MPDASRRLRFISFLVYGAAVLLLFYLALFSRGFSQNVGEVRIHGRYAPFPLLGERRVRDLEISYHGLNLSFSRSRPLVIRTADGRDAARSIDSIRFYSDEADILFEGGVALHLTADPGGTSSYTIAISSPSAEEASLLIAFSLRERAGKGDGAPVLSWSGSGNSYILSVSERSKIDSPAGSLVIASGKQGKAAIRLGADVSPLAGPYASWLSQQAALATPEALQKSFSAFADASFSGWTRTRISTDGASWRGADGAFGVSEDLGQALIAESSARGTYLKYRALYQQAIGQRLVQSPQLPFTLSSSPYIGNLAEFSRRLEARQAAEVERLRRLLAAPDASLGDAGAIVSTLLDHGPFSLVQDALALFEQRDMKRADLSLLLVMLESFLDYASFADETGNSLTECRSIIEKGILPAIRNTDQGMFLVGGKDGTVDVAMSLHAASLLLRCGDELKMPVISSLGRSLMIGSLGLVRDEGFLPATLTLSADAVVSQDGLLAPESIYRYVEIDGYIPRERPLYRYLGPGTWIWSAAKVQSIESTTETLRILFSFPAGLPHYAIIQGVKPFRELQMHGTAWRTDPEYAQYSDGWMYSALSKTLYLKLTEKQEKEEILITY